MFKHLKKQTALTIIELSAATLPSRYKLTIGNKSNLENPVVCISMGVNFHEPHAGYAIDIQTIIKIGDCQTNFLQISMCTSHLAISEH